VRAAQSRVGEGKATEGWGRVGSGLNKLKETPTGQGKNYETKAGGRPSLTRKASPGFLSGFGPAPCPRSLSLTFSSVSPKKRRKKSANDCSSAVTRAGASLYEAEKRRC
jgi:hypothetical protein